MSGMPPLTGVYLEFVDFQEEILKIDNPIFLNDLKCVTKEDREKLNSLIRTNFDGDSISITPSCVCGETNAGRYCPVCRQPVLPPSERPIVPNIWFRAPKDVKALMNPQMWSILRDTFTHNDYCILDWITKSTDVPPVRKHGEIAKLKSLGIQRGYNYFVENFDYILTVLFEGGFYHGTNVHRNWVEMLIRENRHLLFCDYLPIPHKLAFVTEKTAIATYADFSMTGAYNAAITIAEIDEEEGGTSLTVRQNWTVGAINDLSSYYKEQQRVTIGKKEGANRKHIFGTRGNYGGRAVISSLSCIHRYDELHIPWSYAVAMLKVHLLAKLGKLGYDPTSALKYLHKNSKRFDPLLDSIFKELIEEAKDDELGIAGIPCIFQRNPSLARGSAQAFFITKVKDDVHDNTISMSVLVLKAPNGQCDLFQIAGTVPSIGNNSRSLY